jgi:tetratricopeptide (TPR) repeat protein
MKSLWQRRHIEDHAPVEMRFIDMFMTALGSLVFVALMLVFLLPKTTQSKAKDEEVKVLQKEIEQLKRQIPQGQQPTPFAAKTEDKEIVLRRFGVMLVTSGCTEQPELYVRLENKIFNFQTNQPMDDPLQFDAAEPANKTILIEDSYFDIDVDQAGMSPLQKDKLHIGGFFKVSRGSSSYSVYVGLKNPETQTGGGCAVYPSYRSARDLIAGERIVLTRQRPFAWLRRFKINTDGTTTLQNEPATDETFKRDLADFSKRQSQILCERKSICNTMDAHLASLMPAGPTPSEVAFDRGLTFQVKGDIDNAIAQFSEAIRLDSQYTAAWTERGRAYKAKKDLDKALTDFDGAIRIEPTASRFNIRGLVYAEKGDLDRAIEDYTEAIRLDAGYDPALYNRAQAYRAQGKFDRAINDYDEAIRLDAKYAPAYSNRGLVYQAKGDLDHAIADFAAAIQAEPSADRYEQRGDAYVKKGDFAHALADYTIAIRLNPNAAESYSSRGLAYQENGDLDHAIADYNQAVKIEPASAVVYDSRARAYQEKGDLDRAIADFTESIKRDPKNTRAYDGRGDVYRSKGDLEHAIGDYGEAITAEPNAERYARRATAYLAQGDIQHALADYGEAIRLGPTDGSNYTERGSAYLSDGSVAKAEADFQQARNLDPANPYAALWLDIAERHNSVPSHLADYAKKLDMGSWPAPIVRLFLGDLTQAQLLDAAQNPNNSKVTQRRLCDAHLYGAQFALVKGTKEDAERQLRLATEDCPRISTAWATANGQLKYLNANP